MRLIDADAFFNNLDAYSDKNKLQKMLDKQPTAFNIEKVVEQLEKHKEVYSNIEQERYFEGKVVGLSDAIEIVKRGGFNE